jgi:hypothetical protein
MRLDNLYKFAKTIKGNQLFYSEGMEVVYLLDKQVHEQLQKECYIKITNSLTGYVPQNNFELYLLDIKFVFKIK